MEQHDVKAGGLDPAIAGGLRRLARSLRVRLLLRGLGWAAVALLAAAWASFVVDYGLRLITSQHLGLWPRLLIAAAGLGATTVVFWRRALRSLVRGFDERDMALLVERGHPALENRLISALQFARVVDRGVGGSPALMRRVMEEANRVAGGLRFSSVLASRPVGVALLAAAGLALCSGCLAMVRRDVAGPWLRRNLLFQPASYPRRTVLAVEGANPMRVLRGDPLRIVARVEPGKVVPRQVGFHARFAAAGPVVEWLPPSDGDARAFVKSLPMVTEPFTFYLTGNDDRTAPIAVEPVDPPDLGEVELEVRAPPYTGLAPRVVRRGAGTVDVPEEGVLAFRGLARKDLSAAAMLLDEKPIPSFRIGLTDAGAPRRVEGECPLPVCVPFRPSRNLRVELRDREGFANPKAAAFALAMRQDQPPALSVEANGIGAEVTSNAVIPIAVTAKDDYGVAALDLECGMQSAPRRVYRATVRAFMPPAPEPGEVTHALDLRLVAAEGVSNAPLLQVGETLRLQVAASDNRPAASGGAQRTPANPLTFRIVTAEELLARAADVQRSVREQIRHALEMQIESRDRTRAALASAAQATTAGIAYRELAACQEAQAQVHELLGGAIGRLESLQTQLRNNRALAPEDDLRTRTNIVDPLKTVRAGAAAALMARFGTVKSLEPAGALTAGIEALVAMQGEVIRVLEAIVAELIKFEDAQQVERSLRSVIKLGDQVREAIRDGAKVAPRSERKEPVGP